MLNNWFPILPQDENILIKIIRNLVLHTQGVAYTRTILVDITQST